MLDGPALSLNIVRWALDVAFTDPMDFDRVDLVAAARLVLFGPFP